MPLVVRSYTPADRDGFAHVRSRVYRGGVPIGPEEEVMRPDTFGTLAELDGKIIGVETDIDMTCTVRGEVVRCMGIAGVGVLPEARRGGVGLEMLCKALSLYKDRGAAIASLMPYRATYYRKAGYATCGSRLAMRCPTQRFPAFEMELDVWELPPDDYSPVVPCYEAFARRYSGMNARRPEQWRWQLGGDNRFAIYAAGNPVEAYISTRLKTDFWVDQEVRDLAWTTERGYRSILSLLKNLCINKTGAKWWIPNDDPMLWRFDDQGMEVKYDGHMMYRVLDVPAVIGKIRSEGSGEFEFEVDDPHLPENRGPWKVRYDSSATCVEKGSQAGFSLTIGSLTQAALGEPSLQSLAQQGAVQIRDAKAFEYACQLLAPYPTFCLDFF